MKKTIEILEKSVKYAKKQLIEELDTIDETQLIFIKKGIQDTLNFIELLKEIENDKRRN